MSEPHIDASYEQDVQLLNSLVGKKIKSFAYFKHEGILSLGGIIFEDDSRLVLCPSDYGNLVMIYFFEAENDG